YDELHLEVWQQCRNKFSFAQLIMFALRLQFRCASNATYVLKILPTQTGMQLQMSPTQHENNRDTGYDLVVNMRGAASGSGSSVTIKVNRTRVTVKSLERNSNKNSNNDNVASVVYHETIPETNIATTTISNINS
ncbi:hypothetical protein PV327_011359, partial [Microctonus hyperodae]